MLFRSESETVEAVRAATAAKMGLEIVSGGTKRDYGRPVAAHAILDTSALTGIVKYEPEELVLTARAGTPLAEIETLLASRNQMLGFSPADWGPLFGKPKGKATLGGIVADGPIVVRGNGVPVKIACVFGGKGFMQLVVREDSGITKPADLKGKTITVMSYQDTTFYALLGLLASAGLKQDDVNVQSVGPTGVWQFVAEGKSVGMAGVPDWIPPVQAAGVKVRNIPTEDYFPHMAQGIAVSDQTIKDRPEMVRKFVRAALRGMKDMMDDPDKAAGEFAEFVPEWKGREAEIGRAHV